MKKNLSVLNMLSAAAEYVKGACRFFSDFF